MMTYKLACPHVAACADGGAEGIARNVAGAIRAVERSCHDNGAIRVALLPLCFASGGAGVDAGAPDCPALAPLAEAAARLGCFIAGADLFAGVPTSFVIDTSGRFALVQPSLADRAGDAAIDVLDSTIGKIACLAGDDMLHPEYARMAVMAGAEVLLNPHRARRDERSEAEICSRGARAWENLAFVATNAPTLTDGELTTFERGSARAWRHDGLPMAEAQGETLIVTVDLAALRQRRRDPFLNPIAQLRADLYGQAFARYPLPGPPPSAEGPVYDALVMQTHEIFVGPDDDRDKLIGQNLDNALAMATGFAMRPSTRLVVFPEFFLHGTGGRTLDDHRRVSLTMGGSELERIADFARRSNCFVCAAFFEVDDDWPGRFFNTSVIFDPKGDPILRYRKLQCADLAGLMAVTTPGNVFDHYVDRYGFDSLFPVVETEIGVLGTLICFDSNWPELWRALALRGAEVICNPTSEINSERRRPWTDAKRAHAAEQMVYVAAANAGSEQFRPGGPVSMMNSGRSCIIDHNGAYASRVAGGGVVPQLGRIDVGALRRARRDRDEGPTPRFRPEAVVDAYRAFGGFPLNCFADVPQATGVEGLDLVRARIADLIEKGIVPAART